MIAARSTSSGSRRGWIERCSSGIRVVCQKMVSTTLLGAPWSPWRDQWPPTRAGIFFFTLRTLCLSTNARCKKFSRAPIRSSMSSSGGFQPRSAAALPASAKTERDFLLFSSYLVPCGELFELFREVLVRVGTKLLRRTIQHCARANGGQYVQFVIKCRVDFEQQTDEFWIFRCKPEVAVSL